MVRAMTSVAAEAGAGAGAGGDGLVPLRLEDRELQAQVLAGAPELLVGRHHPALHRVVLDGLRPRHLPLEVQLLLLQCLHGGE